MMHTLRVFRVLVWKDIKMEFRGKQFIFSSLSFGVLLLFVMGMALDAQTKLPIDWSAGLLWLNIFFSTAVSMNRHDQREREMGALYGTLLGPFDRSLLFYAKWVSTGVFVCFTALAVCGAFFVILNQPFPIHRLLFVWVFIGGTVGLTGIGTFLATLAAGSSMRDILLPILLFPLSIPLFLAVIRLTEFTMQSSMDFPLVWVEVLVGYIVVFAVLPWLLYEMMLEV